MKLGILSDTHKDEKKAIPHIMEAFKRNGVEMILHCGDIIPEHVSSELFGHLPVACALVERQKENSVFNEEKPVGWQFTRSGQRVIQLPDGTWVYLGHKRHLDFLRATEERFNEILTDLRQDFDGLRFVFGGHLHFQTYKQGPLVSFINPGAVEDALGWGYEYAIVDTGSGQVTFGRILPTVDDRTPFVVSVISDSLDISHRDATYWLRLAEEFRKKSVSHVIHCGNLALTDIGRPELKEYIVHYAVRQDQKYDHLDIQKAGNIPPNWKVIAEEDLDKGAVVEIAGYRFFVQLDLGLEFMKVSELGMDSMAMQIRRKYPETQFVLCGFTREALLVEGQQVTIINPGDVNSDRSFATIRLPDHEIMFDQVPFDALAELPVTK